MSYELFSKSKEIFKNEIKNKTYSNDLYFERAIFLSWICSIGTCKFCYMSTQPKKKHIENIKKAKENPFFGFRHKVSIYVESILIKALNYKVEFISAGEGILNKDYLKEILKKVTEITEEKVILNIGPVPKTTLEELSPYIKGISASIETFSEKHDEICPDKPISLYDEMLKQADQLGLKKGITVILGLGESLDDFNKMKNYIEEKKIDQITFYSLNPEKGTEYENSLGPSSFYYNKWISKTRIEFPKMKIIAGSWANRNRELAYLMESGANNFTKFPAFKLFNKNEAKLFKQEFKQTSRELKSYFDFEDISFKELEKRSYEIAKQHFTGEMLNRINQKLESYLKMIEKNKK